MQTILDLYYRHRMTTAEVAVVVGVEESEVWNVIRKFGDEYRDRRKGKIRRAK